MFEFVKSAHYLPLNEKDIDFRTASFPTTGTHFLFSGTPLYYHYYCLASLFSFGMMVNVEEMSHCLNLSRYQGSWLVSTANVCVLNIYRQIFVWR